MISNLLPCITETGEYLLEAIQNADEENSDELLNMFVIKNKYLLKEAGKCLVYIDIRAEIFKKESMKFDKTHEAIRTFSDEKKRIECLCFEGDFEYRVHIQSSGWTDWTKADGVATLGTVGQELRIEAIQFR